MNFIPELRFPEFKDEWKEIKIKEIFDITRGKVLPKTKMKESPEKDYIYPVYSSQTKNNGLIGFYKDYLFEDAITWTTDGANAGFVRYRKGKFYCTNVCGVLINNNGYANECIAYILNNVTKKYVSYVGNPKLMNNIMAEIKIKIPSLPEQQKIANFLNAIDNKIEFQTKKIKELEKYKKGIMQKLFNGEMRFPEFKNEWRKVKLGEVATFSKGKGFFKKKDIDKNGKYKCIHYGELFTLYKEIIKDIHSKTDKYKNMVISEGNETLMPTSDVTPKGLATASALNEKNIIIGGDILIIKSNKILNNYLSYYIRNDKKQIIKLITGVTVYHIYANDMTNFIINFPSLPEQQKIANFLSIIDDKIELQTKKIEELKKYKKGIMQKLFNTEIRFPEFKNEWREVKLGDYFIQKTKKNKQCKINLVLSVNNKRGFVTQKEQFNGYNIASKDLLNYKIVQKNEFAFNPSRINIGSIAKLKNHDIGIVSPMYIVFKVKEGLNDTYLEYLLLTHKVKHLIKTNCSGSVRKSLSFNDLKKIKIKLPSLPEQQKIANFLSIIDDKIELQTKKIEELKKYKRGIMQKLFNTEIRFPEFKNEWREVKLGETTKIYDGIHQTPKYTETGIPFYSVENVTSNNFNNTKYISSEIYKKKLKESN